uniref:Uncharacterized protein n=1 Tax=Romanomermis culicivorax TaxID=13658 RepID=A0A915IB67_ROMCU
MVSLNLENTTLHAAKTLKETEVRKLHSFCFQKQQHNPRLTNEKQATIYKKGHLGIVYVYESQTREEPQNDVVIIIDNSLDLVRYVKKSLQGQIFIQKALMLKSYENKLG